MATQQLFDGNAEGVELGGAAADLISLYGVTPVSQRAATAVTAASVISVSSNITVAASLTAWIVEVTASLRALGIIA